MFAALLASNVNLISFLHCAWQNTGKLARFGISVGKLAETGISSSKSAYHGICSALCAAKFL